MQRATHAMTTEEHQRWMRRTTDRVIGVVLVVGIAGGMLFAFHVHSVNADRQAQHTLCVALERTDC